MQYIQLTKGVHLLLQPADRNRIDLEFTYSSGGGWFEQTGDKGKRHLLEHCLVSSTQTMNFAKVKDYCFANEIDLNAYTSNLTMSLVASCHKDDFGKIFDLLAEFFFNPSFRQEDLDREKEIVLREISERTGDPNYILYYDTLKQVFTEDSLINNQVIGLAEDVANTTLEDFYRLHRQILNDSHLILKFSGGGFEVDTVIAKVSQKMKQTPNLPAEPAQKLGFLPNNTFKEFTNLPYTHPLGHEHAEVTVFIPCSVNFENRPSQAVFEQLYLKYGGILYDRLRDELGLVYGISGGFRQTIQSLEIELACEIRHIKQILEEIYKTFGDFEKNFKSEKFNQMKDKIRKQKDMSTDNPKFFVDFAENRMLNFGLVEQYEDYSRRLESVDQESIKNLYDQIKQGLPFRKVLVVSKDEKIQNSKIFV